MSKIRLLLAAALLIGSAVLIAADRPAKPTACQSADCPACAAQARVVYPVADLVIPVAGMTGPFPGMPGPVATCHSDKSCCAMLAAFCPSGCSAPENKKTNEETLIKAITRSVQPDCWSCAGGDCTIDYSPIGMALVVNAPEATQQRVAALLESLQRLQDVSVVIEMRLVTVPEEFCQQFGLDVDLCQGPRVIHNINDGIERIGLDFESCDGERCGDAKCKSHAVPITDIQAHLLLEAVQSDRRANVMQAPKLTTLNGQQACLSIQDQQTFVTGVTVETVDDQTRVIPKNKTVSTGLSVSLLPVLSADRRFVSLHLEAEHTYPVRSETPIVPVATQIAPVGGKGKPAAFTQFIQQPKFNTLTCNANLAIPDGGTMLIDAGKIEREARVERQVPLLGKVPLVNRLFRSVSTEHISERLLVLVTPKVICSEPVPPPPAKCDGAAKACCHEFKGTCCEKECCEKGCCKQAKTAACDEQTALTPVPAPVAAPAVKKSPVELRAQKMAAVLVQKYHEACANGDPEMAREYGRQAMDLDPECFFGKTIIKQTYMPMPQPPEISRELSKSRSLDVFEVEMMPPTTYCTPVMTKRTGFDEVRKQMVPDCLRPLEPFEKPKYSHDLKSAAPTGR
jgi:Bacterial type II and III secretion system protein